jgi:RTX calcium-binding nonapeptide repeat (4 copies)
LFFLGCVCGGGDDTFLASGDTVDFVHAGAGDDWLLCGGDDILEGNGGSDLLYSDLATGGFGHDQLSGGSGVGSRARRITSSAACATMVPASMAPARRPPEIFPVQFGKLTIITQHRARPS